MKHIGAEVLLAVGTTLCVGGIVGFALWLFLDKNVDVTVKATFGTALLSLIGVLLTQYYTKRRDIATQMEISRRENQARLFLEKAKAYDKFFGVINDVMQNSKTRTFSERRIEKLTAEGMLEFRKSTVTWSSDKTIQAVLNWTNSSLAPGEENKNVLRATEELMSEI